jgi:hypothetical protein
MFGSAALDVALGLILVYLVFSFLSSAINELLEARFKHRAVDLERGIREMLADPDGNGLAKALYDHPLVCSLYKGKYDPKTAANLPSYIPSRNFALALLDVVVPAGATAHSGAAGAVGLRAADPGNASDLRTAVAAMQNNDTVRRALLTLIDAAGGDITQVRSNVENWFNSAMDRVSGWYKRRKQTIIVIIGTLVAVTLNISTVNVAKTLWANQMLRESLAGAANKYIEAPVAATETPKQRFDRQFRELQSFGLPIGWAYLGNELDKDDPRSVLNQHPAIWLERLIGWLLTGCAISLGAPFWFDLLGKFSVVRSTVKPHEKSPEEPAK